MGQSIQGMGLDEKVAETFNEREPRHQGGALKEYSLTYKENEELVFR